MVMRIVVMAQMEPFDNSAILCCVACGHYEGSLVRHQAVELVHCLMAKRQNTSRTVTSVMKNSVLLSQEQNSEKMSQKSRSV